MTHPLRQDCARQSLSRKAWKELTCLPDTGTGWAGVGWQDVVGEAAVQKLDVPSLPRWGKTYGSVKRRVCDCACLLKWG